MSAQTITTTATVRSEEDTEGIERHTAQRVDILGLRFFSPVDTMKLVGMTVGEEFVESPGIAVLDRMVEEFDRTGRASGKGFHDDEDGRRTHLWPDLSTAVPAADADGLSCFVAHAQELADAHGERFRPSPWLTQRAACGKGPVG